MFILIFVLACLIFMTQLTGMITVSVTLYSLAQWAHCCGSGNPDIHCTLVMCFYGRYLVILLTSLHSFFSHRIHKRE
jgi:hypothetical protein